MHYGRLIVLILLILYIYFSHEAKKKKEQEKWEAGAEERERIRKLEEKKRQDKLKKYTRCSDCDICHRSFNKSYVEGRNLHINDYQFYCSRTCQQRTGSDPRCNEITTEFLDLLSYF